MRNRGLQLPDSKSAGPCNISAQSDRLDICDYDFVITGSTTCETLPDELVDFLQIEVDQGCNSADRNHVRRPCITGRFGEFVGLYPEVMTAFRQIVFLGVVHGHAAPVQVFKMVVVRMLVESN